MLNCEHLAHEQEQEQKALTLRINLDARKGIEEVTKTATKLATSHTFAQWAQP